ncbi:MAG: dihydroneopterin aldolase [Bacillota bacterium]
MDKIVMKNLCFYGYHGAMPEENVLGQKFMVDIALFLDLKKAGETDKVENTVHYGETYELVKDIVENRKYNLIEALAEAISNEIIAQFPLVEEIEVVIKKPGAPVKGIFDYFGVEIRRKRNG